MDKPTLTPMHKLRGQRTFSQVGKTAAYILWGEFLAGDPLSIGFCEVCLHPFIMTRSNKRFYTLVWKSQILESRAQERHS
jgi:hypothetical protein